MSQPPVSTLVNTELDYPSLDSLDLMKAILAISQAHAQVTARTDITQVSQVDCDPVLAELESCLADAGFPIGVEIVESKSLPDPGKLDRGKVIRTIHQAYLRIAENAKRGGDSPANAPVLCVLAGCMMDAGYLDFPLPGGVPRAA